WQGFFDPAMGAVLFDDGAEEAADAEIKGLLKLTGLKPGRALDTACGYGRHGRALAKRGWDVTGVDVMPGYLAEARRRAKAAGVAVRFKRAELKDLRAFRGGFDLVLNLYTSFGYYPTAAANLACLKQMAAALKPGGWLCVELIPRETLLKTVEPYEERPVPGGQLWEERRWLGQGRLETKVTWANGPRLRRSKSVMQTYGRADLAALMAVAGLKDLRAHGSYQGRPFKTGGRLLMLGRRA
ncbi:MAG TPA: class I SAM-dependent methyltransferase, partial [bacterium]|nr:class I SAM-dependent methyltransferase [bacterium]